MSLSDRDLELAKKHALPFTIDSRALTVIGFSPTNLAAFLAERDALAIKEQALVAAAYRVAAGKAFYECDRIRMTCLADVVYEAVISLTPAAAEEKLRALMMEVAKKARYSGAPENIKKVVDEVLNETQ